MAFDNFQSSSTWLQVYYLNPFTSFPKLFLFSSLDHWLHIGWSTGDLEEITGQALKSSKTLHRPNLLLPIALGSHSCQKELRQVCEHRLISSPPFRPRWGLDLDLLGAEQELRQQELAQAPELS